MFVTELPRSGLIAACLTRDYTSIEAAPESGISLRSLLQNRADAVVIVEQNLGASFNDSLETLWHEITDNERTFAPSSCTVTYSSMRIAE
jgi:hypothetical protein